MTEARPRIVIIGAGITGLSIALALRKLDRFDVVVYESKCNYEQTHHQLLWKAGFLPFLELGLGKRLGKIAKPVTSLKTFELESGEPILDWNSNETPGQLESTHDFEKPPAIGVLKIDLIRMLLTALTGRLDLTYDTTLNFCDANNGCNSDNLNNGVEADLAYPNWFEDEGFVSKLPFIKYGHTLESYRISAANEGCDGIHSTVRSLLANDRVRAQHTHQCVIHGITSQTQELGSICSEGECDTFIGKSCSLGLTNIGGQKLAWNFLIPQSNPGQLADQFKASVSHIDVHSHNNLASKNKHDSTVSGDSDSAWLATVDPSGLVLESFTSTLTVSAESKIEKVMDDTKTGSESLNGYESRQMAIHLAQVNGIPPNLLSLISNSNADQTRTLDNMDLYGEHPLKSFTSPKFHPGRVFVIGAAAHALNIAPHGSHGLSIALNDVMTLAKLIGFGFSAQGHTKIMSHKTKSENADDSSDAIILEFISQEFDRIRLSIGFQAMVDAHYESKWVKPEPGFWKSLLNFSGQSTWARTSFEGMQSRGESLMGDDNIQWPRFDTPE